MENDHTPSEELSSREPSVADEIVVDLMKSAHGIEYAEAVEGVSMHSVAGVSIPFSSPAILQRMKEGTHREKDALDLVFLRRLLDPK